MKYLNKNQYWKKKIWSQQFSLTQRSTMLYFIFPTIYSVEIQVTTTNKTPKITTPGFSVDSPRTALSPRPATPGKYTHSPDYSSFWHRLQRQSLCSTTSQLQGRRIYDTIWCQGDSWDISPPLTRKQWRLWDTLRVTNAQQTQIASF